MLCVCVRVGVCEGVSQFVCPHVYAGVAPLGSAYQEINLVDGSFRSVVPIGRGTVRLLARSGRKPMDALALREYIRQPIPCLRKVILKWWGGLGRRH